MIIRQDRPRIFLTPERLSWLKSNQSRPQWQNLLKALTAQHLAADPTKPFRDLRSLNWALHYQVTGDAASAVKAIMGADQIVNLGEAALWMPSSKTLEGTRFVIPQVACVYDWCYDLLTSEQRQRWGNQLVAWAWAVWPETNPDRVGKNGVDNPGDNFYAGFLMASFAGYALANTSQHITAMDIIALNRAKWDRLRAYLEKYSGGYSLEGTNYGNWTRHFYYLAATATATDTNDFLDPTFKWPEQVALTKIHLTAPTRDRLVPFGEQSLDFNAPVTDYQRAAPMILSSHGNPSAVDAARDWLGWIDRQANTMIQTRWEEALWGQTRLINLVPRPLTHYVPEAGYVSVRTSWDEDANWLCFLCGPDRENHQDRGCGQFAIWSGGDWLTCPARNWGGNGLLTPSEYTNVLLVEDPATGTRYGQPAQPYPDRLPKDKAHVVTAYDSGAYFVVGGEAPEAYSYWKYPRPVPVLNKWVRTVEFLEPDEFLISDAAAPTNPAHRILWQMMCEKEPEVVGDSFTVWGPRKNLKGRVYSPAGATIGKEEVRKEKDGSLTCWRLLITCPPAPETLIVVRLRIE